MVLAKLDAMFSLARNSAKGENAPWQDIAQYFEASHNKLKKTEPSTPLHRLKRWRDRIAKQKRIPPFMIIPDHVLADIAQMMPNHMSGLAEIRGMGERRLHAYGQGILEALGAEIEPVTKLGVKIALSGESQRVEALKAIAIELRHGKNGQEKPIEMPKNVIARIASIKPKSKAALSRISGMGR